MNYQARIVGKLYSRLMAITLLMVVSTVLSIVAVSNPISNGDIQAHLPDPQPVSPSTPTPTPSTGVAGANIERADFESSHNPVSTPAPTRMAVMPPSTQSKQRPQPTPTPVLSAITVTPIACALGPTPLPHSAVFCKDIR